MATQSCELGMEGASARWDFSPAPRARETLIGVAEIILEVISAPLRVRSIEFAITADDLERLGNHLERHVEALKLNDRHQSGVFMDYGLGYQIAAAEACVEGQSDRFTITILLNVGTAPSGARVWSGTECQLSSAAALRFVHETRQVVAAARAVKS